MLCFFVSGALCNDQEGAFCNLLLLLCSNLQKGAVTRPSSVRQRRVACQWYEQEIILVHAAQAISVSTYCNNMADPQGDDGAYGLWVGPSQRGSHTVHVKVGRQINSLYPRTCPRINQPLQITSTLLKSPSRRHYSSHSDVQLNGSFSGTAMHLKALTCASHALE
jgi:hypothetical protein